jgi:hypothetical protein
MRGCRVDQDDKVNLAVIASELRTLNKTVSEHLSEDRKLFAEIREALDGCDEYPGVRGRLYVIEEQERRRKHHIYAIWAALCAAVAGWFVQK